MYLMMGACLAYLWMVYLGCMALVDGWVSVIHRNDRCDWSLFQLGVKIRNFFLNEADAIPVAFHIISWDMGRRKKCPVTKQINRRKRHLLVDTLGLIIRVVVITADSNDRIDLMNVLSAYFADGIKRLKKLWGDSGYSGDTLKEWVATLKTTHKIDLEVVAKVGSGFQVLQRRWVVERTFAWMLNYRRDAKDYEVLPRSSEALIEVAMIYCCSSASLGKTNF